MGNNTNKDKTINTLRQAIGGVQKHFGGTPTIVLDGKPMAPGALVATFQAAIKGIDDAVTAEQAFHDTVAAQNAAIAAARAGLRALKKLVESQLGSASAIFGDFGFPIPTRKTPTEATKAAAVAKREATRAARGTRGKRQKAGIKGQVPAAPVTTTPKPQ
jgi:hypothetical protein